jgi:hypothetical protein
MSADINAICYEWYMDVKKSIVKWVWEPIGEFTSSMTFGSMAVHVFNEETGKWEPMEGFSKIELPWAAAGHFARGQGFPIEKPIYSAKSVPDE